MYYILQNAPQIMWYSPGNLIQQNTYLGRLIKNQGFIIQPIMLVPRNVKLEKMSSCPEGHEGSTD
jgi:hypothetical protein